jgi:hypothetical protein
MGDEERKTAAAVLAEKYKYGKYSYYEQIKKPLLACLIERRLEKGVTANTARLYLESECGESDFEGAWREFRDEEDRELFSKTTGFESLADIPKNALAQKLFLFFVLRSINERDLPNINESEEGFAESERSLTWKFIGITREEYEALYREKLKDAVSELTGVPDKPNGGGVAPENITASGRSKRRKA